MLRATRAASFSTPTNSRACFSSVTVDARGKRFDLAGESGAGFSGGGERSAELLFFKQKVDL
jgi:hypothetical protein